MYTLIVIIKIQADKHTDRQSVPHYKGSYGIPAIVIMTGENIKWHNIK